MLKGKILYSDIFFNHQFLMAYISYYLQLVLHPQSIYELLLRHRQFLLLFGFVMDFLIIYRFRFAGAAFVLFYEFSKFYLFGNRFLAEGFVVYPIVYTAGLIWYKFRKEVIYHFDYILTALFTWFVIFMREPYTLVVVISYGFILLGKKSVKTKIISITLFAFLTIIVFLNINIKDYIFNVFTTNNQVFFASEIKGHNLLGPGILKAFFYNIYLFFNGTWGFFRYFIVSIDVIFLFSLLYFLKSRRNFIPVLSMFLLLGLSNLRIVEPGIIFYGSFYLLPWYGIFLLVLFLLVKEALIKNKKIGLLLICLLTASFSYLTLSSNSYLREKPNPHYDLITNYGKELQTGSVVKVLTDLNDRVFLDGGDDLIYWQSDRTSSYKYSWYTSIMPYFPKYLDARMQMFKTNPPEFYYAFCSKNPPADRALPSFLKDKYQEFYTTGNPTCLYIRKDKINKIPAEKWKKAKQWLFELKPN